MKSRLRHTVVPVVAVVAALTLAGCGAGEKAGQEAADRLTEKALSQDGQDVDVDSGDGSVSVKTEDGTVAFGEDVDLPEEFPDDVPLPRADFKVVSAATQGGEVSVMLSLADLDFEAEKEHLTQELEAAGYTLSDTMDATSDGNGFFSVTATLGERTVGVVLSEGDGVDGSTAMYSVKG